MDDAKIIFSILTYFILVSFVLSFLSPSIAILDISIPDIYTKYQDNVISFSTSNISDLPVEFKNFEEKEEYIESIGDHINPSILLLKEDFTENIEISHTWNISFSPDQNIYFIFGRKRSFLDLLHYDRFGIGRFGYFRIYENTVYIGYYGYSYLTSWEKEILRNVSCYSNISIVFNPQTKIIKLYFDDWKVYEGKIEEDLRAVGGIATTKGVKIYSVKIDLSSYFQEEEISWWQIPSKMIDYSMAFLKAITMIAMFNIPEIPLFVNIIFLKIPLFILIFVIIRSFI